MDGLIQDLRYAARTLLRSPGFTLVAVLTLALGIGANTAIFSVVRAVLLRPLPYAEAGRVVMVWNHWTGTPRAVLSEPELADYRGLKVIERVGAFDDDAANLTGGGVDPERVRVGLLSADVLPALGVAPQLGRNFHADEDRPGGPAVVLLGAGVWRRRFGASPGVVGRALSVNGRPRTVVGVLPDDFRLPIEFAATRSDIYVPLALGPAAPLERDHHYLRAAARLAPGVSLASAQSAVDAFLVPYRTQYRYGPGFGVTLVAVGDEVFGAVRPALALVAAAVAFVLLLACVNVASLLLMRAEGRARELAVRRAIGAGSLSLVRLALAESVALAAAGGALGLLLSSWVVDELPRLSPESLPRIGAVRVDATVIAFAAIACLVTAVACGLWPAWRAVRSDPQAHLAEGARGSRGRGVARMRRAVIAAEVALAVMLCVGGGLLLRSFAALSAVRPGFAPSGVLTFRLSAPPGTYPTGTSVRAVLDDILGRLRALPGVTAAGAGNALPLASVPGDWTLRIEGRPVPGPRDPDLAADWLVATPGYQEALGMRLVAGRWLSDADVMGAPGAVVINEATAREYWRGGNPIGARIRLAGTADTLWRTIVGVVANVHQNALDADPRRQMFLPHAQFPSTDSDAGAGVRDMSVAIRSTRPQGELVREVRGVLHDVDPNLPLAVVRSLEDVVRAATATPRFALVMVGSFALLALLMAGIGVYGVVAYAVALRSREIGVRIALGAQRGKIFRMIVGQGMRPAAFGIAVGVAVALAARGMLASLLYRVPATDPLALAGAALLLAGVGAAACWLPARRAAGVDPVIALRSE